MKTSFMILVFLLIHVAYGMEVAVRFLPRENRIVLCEMSNRESLCSHMYDAPWNAVESNSEAESEYYLHGEYHSLEKQEKPYGWGDPYDPTLFSPDGALDAPPMTSRFFYPMPAVRATEDVRRKALKNRLFSLSLRRLGGEDTQKLVPCRIGFQDFQEASAPLSLRKADTLTNFVAGVSDLADYGRCRIHLFRRLAGELDDPEEIALPDETTEIVLCAEDGSSPVYIPLSCLHGVSRFRNDAGFEEVQLAWDELWAAVPEPSKRLLEDVERALVFWRCGEVQSDPLPVWCGLPENAPLDKKLECFAARRAVRDTFQAWLEVPPFIRQGEMLPLRLCFRNLSRIPYVIGHLYPGNNPLVEDPWLEMVFPHDNTVRGIRNPDIRMLGHPPWDEAYAAFVPPQETSTSHCMILFDAPKFGATRWLFSAPGLYKVRIAVPILDNSVNRPEYQVLKPGKTAHPLSLALLNIPKNIPRAVFWTDFSEFTVLPPETKRDWLALEEWRNLPDNALLFQGYHALSVYKHPILPTLECYRKFAEHHPDTLLGKRAALLLVDAFSLGVIPKVPQIVEQILSSAAADLKAPLHGEAVQAIRNIEERRRQNLEDADKIRKQGPQEENGDSMPESVPKNAPSPPSEHGETDFLPDEQPVFVF